MSNKRISLIEAILALRTPQDAKRFLRDLLTKKEIIEFNNRWQAAQMLDSQVPYSEIISQTGLSSTTVARIAKWLRGSVGGYRLVLRRFARHHRKSRSLAGSRMR